MQAKFQPKLNFSITIDPTSSIGEPPSSTTKEIYDTKIAKIHESILRYCRKGGIGGILDFFMFLIPLFVFFYGITFAFCAGPEAELMEQFSGIDQEDVRYYLLEGWKEIGTLIEKTQLHFLPNPQMGYDIIESLQARFSIKRPYRLAIIVHDSKKASRSA